MKRTPRAAPLIFALLLALSWLSGCGRQGGTYVVYTDSAVPPFAYYDAGTESWAGLELDILAAVAADQGFAYTVQETDADTAMSAVQSGQADGMISAVPITGERERIFDFSDSYFDDGQVMAVAAGSAIAGPENLQGKLLACLTGSPCADWAEANADTYGYTVQYYDSAGSLYEAVLSDSCDACLGQRAAVGWAIKQDSLGLQMVGELVNPQSFGFAVKRGVSAKLLGLFSAGLRDIKANGKLAAILEKYGYT